MKSLSSLGKSKKVKNTYSLLAASKKGVFRFVLKAVPEAAVLASKSLRLSQVYRCFGPCHAGGQHGKARSRKEFLQMYSSAYKLLVRRSL